MPPPIGEARATQLARHAAAEAIRHASWAAADLGVGILIIPQKPWKEVAKELTEYHELYRQINGVAPPPPISAGWTFCDRDPDRAREQARRWIGGYFRRVLDQKHHRTRVFAAD